MDTIEQYLAAQLPNAETRRAYAGVIRRFTAWLNGRTPSAELVRDHVLVLRAGGLKASSERTYLRALRLYGRCLGQDLTTLIKAPPLNQALPQYLTQAEAAQMLAAAKQPFLGRAGLVYQLLYITGIRLAELLGIRQADIHAAEECVLVRGKGAKERLVWITPEVMAHLTSQAAAAGDGPVFAISRETVRRDLRRVAYAAGVQRRVWPHLMRHTCATHTLEGGADLRVIQEQLGHSDPSMTARYAHVTLKRRVEAMRAAHPMGRTVGKA